MVGPWGKPVKNGKQSVPEPTLRTINVFWILRKPTRESIWKKASILLPVPWSLWEAWETERNFLPPFGHWARFICFTNNMIWPLPTLRMPWRPRNPTEPKYCWAKPMCSIAILKVRFPFWNLWWRRKIWCLTRG